MRKYVLSFFIVLAIASISFGREPELLHTLKVHDARVILLAFSLDCKTLASSTEGGNVQLWDVNAGKNICVLYKGSDCCDALAFSPDGKILAGGSDCKILWLWDPIKKEEIAKFTTHSMSHSRYSSAFAFTPDGKTIQTWNSDYDGNLESITFWDVATQTRTDEVKLQPGIYRRMAFSPDCKIFAAVFGDIPIITMPDSTIYIPSVIKLYETATGKKLNTLKGRGNNVDYFIFSPDGKTLAAQSEGISFRNADNTSDIQTPGMLELWDVKTGNNLLTIKEGTEYIRALAFSPDGKILALGHFEDPIIELRDVSSGKIITLLKGHENENDGIMCMSFSPNGKMLASGRSDGTIEIWDIQGLGITGKSPSSTVNAPDAKTAKQIKKVK